MVSLVVQLGGSKPREGGCGLSRGVDRQRAGVLIGLIAVTAVPLLAGGCDRETSERRDKRMVRLIIVGEAQDDPTWSVLQLTATRFQAEERFAVVEAVAPPTRSPRQQRVLLEGLAARGADAVCIAATDADAVRPTINLLVQKGIPVVTFGRDVPDSGRVVYCGPLEDEIGRAAAEACVAAVQARRTRTVMLLHSGLDDPVYGRRYRSFKRHLAPEQSVVLLREIDCAPNRSDLVVSVRLESRKYPRTACWVFLEDWPLRGLRADDRLLPRGCGLVLCNGSPRYFPLIRDGRATALIGYNFRRAAEEALLAAFWRAEESTSALTPHHITPVEVITIENVTVFEERWRSWRREGGSDLGG